MLESNFSTGGSYIGERDSHGKRHGRGILKSPDGDSQFIGEFVEGVPSGYGVQTMNNRYRYAGQFVEGVYHGDGVLTRLQDNFMVEGAFKRGKLNGFGRVYFPDGTSGIPFYEGLFKSHRLVQQEKCADQLERSRLAGERAIALERDILTQIENNDEETQMEKKQQFGALARELNESGIEAMNNLRKDGTETSSKLK